MKKVCLVSLLIILISSVTLSLVDISDPYLHLECREEGDALYCPQNSYALDVDAIFIEDIECFSDSENASCVSNCYEEIPDLACISFIELTNDIIVKSCETKITEDEIVADAICQNKTIKSGIYDAYILPSTLDYSKCSKFWNETTSEYVVLCPYTDKHVILDALVLPTETFAVAQIRELPGIGISNFLQQNLIYIILIIIILVILFWTILSKRKIKIPKVKLEPRERYRMRRRK